MADFGRAGNYFVRQLHRWQQQWLPSRTGENPTRAPGVPAPRSSFAGIVACAAQVGALSAALARRARHIIHTET